MARKREDPINLAELKAQNARLLEENEQLQKLVKKENIKTEPSSKRSLGTVGFVLLTGLAGVTLVAADILFWLNNNLLNTSGFSATASQLIKNTEIQKALAHYTTERIFANSNVEETLQNSLPPNASFIAPALATQIKNYTENASQSLFASEAFQNTWTNTLAEAHERIIRFARTYEGDGTITLQSVYDRIVGNLENTRLSFLAGKQLPANIGSEVVVEASWLPALHSIVAYIGLYQFLSVVGFLGASTAAVLLSKNRRKTIIQLGILCALYMFILLLVVRLVNMLLVNQAPPPYQAARESALAIVSQPLITSTRALLLLSSLVALAAWIGGPYKTAAAMRSRVQLLLAGQAHKALFRTGENVLTLWIGAHKRMLQWLSVAIAVIIMLLATLSPLVVLWCAVLLLGAVLIIELLAAETAQKVT